MFKGFADGSCDGGRSRVGLFECECGCGQTFFFEFATRHPKYANRTHKMRAYRARARDRAEAYNTTR